MKNKVLFILILGSLSALSAEVRLEDSHITKNKGYFSGSVTGVETKNVIVVDGKDIKKKNYTNVVDIFKDSPATVVTYTKTGPVIQMRGSGERSMTRVQVLLDGHSITSLDETMGVIPFNAIPIQSIEKIEIIPGGGVTLYGGGTVGGVVNIITNSKAQKNYGNINITRSSYDNNDFSATAGVQIQDKGMLHVAGEYQKTDGYRDYDKNEKRILNTAINLNLNEKNSLRLKGNYYKENIRTSAELPINKSARDMGYYDEEIKQPFHYTPTITEQRRGKGDSEIDVVADRKEFGIDYNYRPNDKFNLTISGSNAIFARDINQISNPDIQILPMPSYVKEEMDPFMPEQIADFAVMKPHNELKGKFEEKIKDAKVKGEYKYNNNKGKLTFGYEYKDHNLIREANSVLEPVTLSDIGVIWRESKKYEKNSFQNGGTRPYAIRMNRMMKMGPLLTFTSLTLANAGKEEYVRKIAPVKAEYMDEFVDSLNMTPKHEGYIVDPLLTFLEYKIGDVLKEERLETYVDYELNTSHEINGGLRALQEDIREYKENPEKKLKEDKYFLYSYPAELHDQILALKPITRDSTFKDVFEMQKLTNAELRQMLGGGIGATVDSKVDMNKKTHSLFLRNDYQLTDKLGVYAGARWEKAEYEGFRRNKITFQLSNGTDPNTLGFLIDTKGITESIQGDYPGTSSLDFWRDAEKGGTINLIAADKYNQMENNSVDNFGGEVGLNYNYRPTGTVYAKYERAFISPLPSQLTNKEYNQKFKTTLYMPSGIKSEKVDTVEVGIRDFVGKRTSLGLALYGSLTHDEISMLVRDGHSHMFRRWAFANIAESRRLGAEFTAQHYFDKFTIKESLSYVDAEISKVHDSKKYKFEKGSKVPMVPKLKATLGIEYIPTNKLLFGANYTYVSSYETNEPGKGDTVVNKKIKGHGVLDLSAKFSPTENFYLKLGVNNVLDEEYSLREDSHSLTPAPGRNYSIGFNYKF